MKEIYIPKKVPRIEVREKLHGHTQILLRSERTGKVERIEHDNMFTDALEEYLKSTGWLGLSILRLGSTNSSGYMTNSPYASFFGGILLFDTNISTGSSIPPAVNMTANARYGSSNSGEVTELGSYNAVESSFGSDSYTFVYDWGTSQGNGNIGSVCIVPNEFGYIGLGNGSSKVGYNWDWKSYNDNISQSYPMANNNIFNHVFSGNHLYYTPVNYISNASSITIYKKKYVMDEFDAFVGVCNSTSDAEAISISFGTTLPSTWYIKPIPNMGAYFYVGQSMSINNGETATFYIIDAENGTATPYTITNTTGRQLNGNGYGCADFVVIDDTYIILSANTSSGSSYSYYVYKHNYKTDTLIGLADGCPSLFTSGGYSQVGVGMPCFITPKHLLYARPASTSSHNTYSVIYDTENNRVLPTNASMGGSYNTSQRVGCYIKDTTNMTIWTGLQQYDCRAQYVRYNPFRLMTINNLDFPVTKTADKTMKVTYTITRA